MKKSLAALTAAFTLAGSGMTFASTAELIVKGVITPSACNPTLPNGNVVDHGKISAKDLNPNAPTTLPPAVLRLNVKCEAATLFALRGTDNRAGSSTVADGYGLGLASNGRPIGNYTLALINAVADTVVVSSLESSDDGTTWHETAGGIWKSLSLAAFGKPGEQQPTPIEEVNAELKVVTEIVRTSTLPLENDVDFNGSATLEVKYL